MSANQRQVGGDHYKKGGEEHWDRAWRLKYDPFQYIITKWVERWREKGGLQDLQKAQHALEKYIELVGDGEPGEADPWSEMANRALALQAAKADQAMDQFRSDREYATARGRDGA